MNGVSYCVILVSYRLPHYKVHHIPLCCIDICSDLIEQTEETEAHGKRSSSYQWPFAHRDAHVRSQLCILQIKSNSLRALNSSFIWRMYSEQSTNMSLRKALHSLKKAPPHTYTPVICISVFPSTRRAVSYHRLGLSLNFFSSVAGPS